MARSRLRLALQLVVAALVAIFLVLQLLPANERTNPPVQSEIEPPPEVAAILRRACYDCHSNETQWPWYSRVAPASWWMISHVRVARGDLNFSEWPTFDLELQELALRDIEEQIKKHKMPLPSYLLLHPEARLDDEARQVLLDWARSGP